MTLFKLGKFLIEWVIPILGGFFVMFSLSFSVSWGMSYLFLDLIFAPMLSDMAIPFDVTSNFFRFVLCSSASLLAIVDVLRERMNGR